MNIAIDAHTLGSQTGGNETYFRQLVNGLAANESVNSYTIFYTHSTALKDSPNDRRFQSVAMPSNPILRLGAWLPLKLASVRPDVFHCQYIQPLFTKTRIVVTIYDLAYEHYSEFFTPSLAFRLKRLVRWTAQRANHIMTVSHFCAADISRVYGIAPQKITVAYPAPACTFRPRDKSACREHLARNYQIRSPFILYTGRLQARKNLPRLIEAYARVVKEFPELKLVVVGKKDWQSERVFDKIKELHLESAVILPGYVSSEDLPLFYNAAEAFVFPSFFEGFGLPVVEAMASGVPTITSQGSSLEEVAGGAALLVNPNSVESIAAAMLRVLDEQNLQRQLIDRGLRRSSEFSAEELPAKALEVYRILVGD